LVLANIKKHSDSVYSSVEVYRLRNIFNLIDSCNQASVALRIAAEQLDNEEFGTFVRKTCQMLDLFSYELHTEIQRNEDSELRVPRSYHEETLHPDLLISRCIELLQATFDLYDSAIASRLTAHSRAMLRRQQLEIKEAYEQLTQLQRVA
jgi:hypothetical protein